MRQDLKEEFSSVLNVENFRLTLRLFQSLFKNTLYIVQMYLGSFIPIGKQFLTVFICNKMNKNLQSSFFLQTIRVIRILVITTLH